MGFQNDGDSVADDAVQRKHAMSAAISLAGCGILMSKKAAASDILDAFNIHPSDSIDLPFYFNRKAVAHIPTNGIFSSGPVTPSLALITFDTIQLLRREYICRPSYTRFNAPVHRIQQKKLASIKPPNRAEDPYIVAILVALAQKQRRRRQQQ
ncbi:hypothetical protein BO71DRAFT_487183 [Aspergillus ellipticus CBS 707.79]|uniref:Uncharacterized protein n=1 Tax=Aspergillus ellipticus CBS 707.79 TaxID=1448320 RepID=A0A319EHB8_9EURO|nr:hypothetical protein BO71DRAFT_487183 [Aspergillus ellipticus CBS 707.79]